MTSTGRVLRAALVAAALTLAVPAAAAAGEPTLHGLLGACATGGLYDVDADGKLDAGVLDQDGDGHVDQNALDTNGDGAADTWGIDADEDCLLDQAAYDRTGDGRPDAWLLDTDADGRFDAVALDSDADGVVDETRTADEAWTLAVPGNPAPPATAGPRRADLLAILATAGKAPTRPVRGAILGPDNRAR